MQYTLDGHTPVPCDDTEAWAEWMEEASRTGARFVAKTQVTDQEEVSTVFLGIDHGWFSERPILFETMVFAAGKSRAQRRYATWEEAERGHMEEEVEMTELEQLYRLVMGPGLIFAENALYVVRHWDGMDGCWTDVTQPGPPDAVLAVWAASTKGGTKMVCFDDIDYFKIFPADTRMAYDADHEMFR